MTSGTSKIRKKSGVDAGFDQDKIITMIFKALEANEMREPSAWDKMRGVGSGRISLMNNVSAEGV